MKDINDLKNCDTSNSQWTTAIKYVSYTDTDEERVMHSKSDNIELITYDNAEEVTEGLFESLLNRYQIGFKKSIRDSDFLFDYVYYKCHEINPN